MERFVPRGQVHLGWKAFVGSLALRSGTDLLNDVDQFLELVWRSVFDQAF